MLEWSFQGEPEMEMGWVLGGFFVFVTLIYIAVALLAPEWVGIQGRLAKKIEEEHRGGSDDNISKTPKDRQ